jgi:hypothetical protein
LCVLCPACFLIFWKYFALRAAWSFFLSKLNFKRKKHKFQLWFGVILNYCLIKLLITNVSYISFIFDVTYLPL